MPSNTNNLSPRIGALDEVPSSLTALTEELHQTYLETDFLLQASEKLQLAYSSLLSKVEKG